MSEVQDGATLLVLLCKLMIIIRPFFLTEVFNLDICVELSLANDYCSVLVLASKITTSQGIGNLAEFYYSEKEEA